MNASPLHPRVAEAVEQLDATILNGDYFLQEEQLKELDFYITRWARVHAGHLRDLAAGVYGDDAPKPPPPADPEADDIRLLNLS